jgi:hypothetical protein
MGCSFSLAATATGTKATFSDPLLGFDAGTITIALPNDLFPTGKRVWIEPFAPTELVLAKTTRTLPSHCVPPELFFD